MTYNTIMIVARIVTKTQKINEYKEMRKVD